MALALALNLPPEGSRAGSSIEVVDTFIDNGQTKGTVAIPIPTDAKVNDYIEAFLTLGAPGVGHGIISTFMKPAGAMAMPANVISGGTSSGTIQTLLLTKTVVRGDPGTIIEFRFICNVFVSWALTSRTLRYVNLNNPIDVITTGVSLSDITPPATTPATPITTTIDGDLIVACLGAQAGPTAGSGIVPGPLPGWYNTVDAMGSAQPNVGQVSGIVDMPIASDWQGASCVWNQGTSPPAPANYASITVATRPLAYPSSPVYTLTPGGPSVDMAGLSGLRPTVSWVYTPTGGQGTQVAWLLARQETGTHANAAYWDAALNVWSPVETWNYGKASSYQWPSGAWVDDGRSWDIYGAVTEGARNYKTPLTFIATLTADPPPLVTVTAPAGAPGAAGPVTWSPVLPAGYVEETWFTRVFSSDAYTQPGFSPSGILDDATSYPNAFGIGSWSARTNCSVASAGGSLGVKMTATAGGNMDAVSTAVLSGTTLTSLTARGIFACTPGQSITTYQMFTASGAGVSRSCQAGLWFFDATGNAIGSPVRGASVTDASTGIDVTATLVATAPAGAVYFILAPLVLAAGAGENHFVDLAMAFTTSMAPRAFSGRQSGTATTWTPSPALRGGARYRAYVRIQQTMGQLSPWAYTSWWANYNTCALPTVVATPDTDPVTGAPRAKIVVTGHDPSTLTGTTYVNLWRYDPTTQANVAVRFSQNVPVLWPSQVVTLYDYELPPRKLTNYQAEIYSTSPTGP